jgi:hypothetical protein
LSSLPECGRLRNGGPIEKVYNIRIVVTHLARTEGIYIWLPHVLERDRSTAGRRAAELPTPCTASDIPNNIPIASHVVIFFGKIVGDGVDPACHEFPAGTVVTRDVATANTLPHGNFEVPCDHETVAATCVENAFWGRATNELGSGV